MKYIKRLNIPVTESMKNELGIYAEKRGETVSSVIRRRIAALMNRKLGGK